MKKQPLFILCICFILGIFAQENFHLDKHLILVCLCVSLVFCLSGFLRNWYLVKFRNYFLRLFFFTVGLFSHYIQISSLKVVDNQDKELVFKLDKKLNSNEKNRRYEVIFFNGKQTFPSVLSIPKDLQELDFLHYYKAKIYINRVEAPQNDFQFNYAKYLQRKNIFYQAYLPNNFEIANRNDLTLSEKLKQRRLDVLQNINHADFSPKTREFLKGIILADRTEMDSETVSDFNKTGLVHFLAISGSHIAIIFGIFFWLFTKIFPLRFRNYAILCSLLAIWFFGIFIGLGSSVSRACIMISVYYLSVLFQRKPDLIHSMALAAFFILIFDTQQLFDVGFQLSFLAVLGIFWLNQPILNYLPKCNTTTKKIIYNTLSMSLAAQIATLPLVLYYFHQFSLVSIIANLVIIPTSEIIIIASLVMTVLLAFKIDFSFVNVIYDGLVSLLLKVIHWFSEFDLTFFENIPMSLPEVLILLFGFYFLRKILLKQEIKSILNFGFVMLAFFAIRLGFNIYHYNKSEVLVVNNFKQKAIIVKQNDHAIFYIDDNLNPVKIQKSIVNPYISSRRIHFFNIETKAHNATEVVVNNVAYSLK